MKIIHFLILIIFMHGCGSESSDVSMNKQENSQEKEKSEVEKSTVFTYQIEDINKSSHYDQARIQFLWKQPGKIYDEIWSMKVDGSDLALVVDENWLYEEVDHWGHINTPAVRSPDNRYIAVIQHKSHLVKSMLRIIDLKNKTSEELFELGGKKAPQWSIDGQSLYFRKGGWITRYDIQTKILTKIVDNTSRDGFYLTNQGTRLTTYDSSESEIRVFDLRGDLLNKIKMKVKGFRFFESISEDGEIISYRRYGSNYQSSDETGFILKNQPEKERYHIQEYMNKSIISPDNHFIFISGPSKYEIKTGKEEHLFYINGNKKEFGMNINLYNLDKWK